MTSNLIDTHCSDKLDI